MNVIQGIAVIYFTKWFYWFIVDCHEHYYLKPRRVQKRTYKGFKTGKLPENWR